MSLLLLVNLVKPYFSYLWLSYEGSKENLFLIDLLPYCIYPIAVYVFLDPSSTTDLDLFEISVYLIVILSYALLYLSAFNSINDHEARSAMQAVKALFKYHHY